MPRPRRTRQTDETAVSLPAVANPVTGEDSREIWQRWSQERTERDHQERILETAVARAQSERGIYAVEIARHVAQEHAQGCCPEWRYLRDLCREDFARILREQPEMRLASRREVLMNAVFAELPEHMRGVLAELRKLLELVSLARESAAFLIAFETGREAGRRDALRDPRVMLAPDPARRSLPPMAQPHAEHIGDVPQQHAEGGRAQCERLRLTLADET